MFLHVVVRVLVTGVFLCALGIGLIDYLKNMDENECSMTWMKQSPILIPVTLDPNINSQFPFYQLYLYCEASDCHRYESLRFTRPSEIPILFITGNADSHKQVRSLASIAAYKALKSKYAKRGIRFHYFTVSFNEELSALYGPILTTQTEYVKHCIKHIIGLFSGVKPEEKRPKSVLVIGNSMGGLIARGLFLPTETPFNTRLVHTVITESTPHNRPVINLDKQMADYYSKVNQYWLNRTHSGLKNVVLVSLYGGVRDILVRSGLSNVNEWRGESNAAIISSYTVSMPNVWRSVDHRCMAWCRELVMAINRGLFDLIDPKTEQLFESRDEREKILRRHFERNFPIENETTRRVEFAQSELTRIEAKEDAFMSWNDFNEKKRLFLFDLESLTQSFDSLFLYTNINLPKTIVACKVFNQLSETDYECLECKDLLSIYGRSIPPYLEDLKEQTLATMNLNNLKSQLLDLGYSQLVVSLPVMIENKSKYQLILKLDWYTQETRFETLKKTPVSMHSIEWTQSDGATFRRYYLENFRSVWQAYLLVVNLGECDLMEVAKSASGGKQAQLKPLSSSNVFVQFYEPVSVEQTKHKIEQIYHSQAIQGKTKNLTLRLSVNHHRNVHNQIPYIDIIKFEPEHLLPKSSSPIPRKCSSSDSPPPSILLEFDYEAMLGQLVRFYVPLIPAFLVAILQIYDFALLLYTHSTPDLHSNFVLSRFNANYLGHLVYSYILALLCYALPYFNTDYQHLQTESTDNFLAPLFLYWFAYALLNAIALFVTFNHTLASFVLNRVVVSCVRLVTSSWWAKKVTLYLHVLLTCLAMYWASSLAHCSLFYAMVIRLALNNPNYNERMHMFDHLRYLNMQTRYFFHYVLLMLNLPGLIVWVKSLSASGSNVGELVPLRFMMGDSGTFVAGVALGVYVIYSVTEASYSIKVNYFSLNSIFLALLVAINSVLTVLYATVSIYRLQYFVIVHLFLMCFMTRRPLKSKSD